MRYEELITELCEVIKETEKDAEGIFENADEISNIIDNIMKEELPDYDSCVSGETFNTIYEYNKKYMYEREQERKREENA